MTAALLTLASMTGAARAEYGAVAEFAPKSWRTGSLTEDEGVGRARSSPAAAKAARRAGVSASSAEAPRRARQPQRTRIASLGRVPDSVTSPQPSLSGGGAIVWRAGAGCLASNLRTVIASVAASFGAVTVNSTCRNASHNRRVGGATRSYHLTGDAADIRIRGNVGAAIAYLRSAVGGFKHYGGGLFHIDNGPRRPF